MLLLLDSDVDWMEQKVDSLIDHVERISPSEWAERDRYLPASVTPMPGRFSFKVMPFLREIVDCFDTRSPIREVNFMKGSQLGWTTGVLENIVGYSISVVKSAPMMWLTADLEMAKLRMDQNVTPMIQQSDLETNIQSNDNLSVGKKGKTNARIEWVGNGYLLPYGANSPNKMRQTSIKYLLEDEVDGYPLTVGKDGDPCAVAESRCKGYWAVRKIMRGSTPLEAATSKIAVHYKDGDQRHYMVKCLNPKCRFPQQLRFNGKNDDGKEYGLIYDLNKDDNLVPGSVRYRCKACAHDHREGDKMAMLADGNAEWVPTAIPKNKNIRSYHLSSLYSPSTMFQWTECIQAYLDSWDVVNNRVKDMGKFKYFYNHVLGETFKTRSNRLKFETVSMHRREEYTTGHIPNHFANQYCNGPISVVTCAIDIHKSHIDMATFGWARGEIAFSIDTWKFEGDCMQLNSAPWEEVRNIIEKKVYFDNDGHEFKIEVTLVDSSWNTDLALAFCDEYEKGVIPIQGKPVLGKKNRIVEFQKFVTGLGTIGYTIFVDFFKDRWQASLRREWDGLTVQTRRHFNAPINISDQRLKELTTEHKKQKMNRETHQAEGWLWYRPPGAANEFWDLLIYNNVALEIIAYELMVDVLENEEVDWFQFWNYAEQPGRYFDKS